MTTPLKKTCSKCHESKTTQHFHLCKNGKYGVHSICKPCRIAVETIRATRWREDNREQCNATTRKRYQRKKAAATADGGKS